MSKILAIFRMPDMTTERYDKIHKELDAIHKRHVKERAVHIMATWNEGATVIDVWDSQEDLDNFYEILGPLLKKYGVTQVDPEILPVYDFFT